VRPLRLGVVGVGHLGRIHTRLISQIDGLELVGVVDPVEANRRDVAAQWQTEAFESHTDLLGRVDAAIIATPTQLHHRVALDLINRGVHLLIEKPLTANRAEASELVEAAQKQKTVLQVGHVERFNPAWSAALPHVREPKYIEAVRRSGFSFRSTDIGAVLDLMIHDLDLILSLVQSRVERVEALGISIFGGHEDVANARLTFENGCVATLNASRASYQAARTMQIWSTRAFASLDFSARTASIIRPSETLLRRELDIDSLTQTQKVELKDRLLAEHLPLEQIEAQPSDAITAELVDFADSIRRGRQPRVSGEQARDAVSVAEEILAQISTHRWNGSEEGPIGPLAVPGSHVLRGPHWAQKPTALPRHRREAG
jgi:predicted dehydrogenase